MKKYLEKLGLLSLVVTLLVPAIAVAAPADAPAGSTIQQRTQLRLKEQKVKLDKKELTRYKGRCIGTQTVVRDIQSKLGQVTTNRQNTYKAIDGKLWIIIGQLKLAGKDTYNLEKQRAELATKVAAYDSTLTQYRQTLDDLVVINCQADLNGFIAITKTAQDYHASIITQSEAIKSYVVDTVKKTLSDFATDLQPKTSTENAQ